MFDESDLLRQVSNGNERAFTALFKFYGRLLLPFLYRLTGSTEDAEEIVQETMLQVWIHRDQLPGLQSPRSWLFKIASNRAYTALTRQAIHNKILNKLTFEESYNSVEQNMSLVELKIIIKEAVNNMSPQRRAIYQLSRESSLSVNEIAEKLNLSKNTVKNTLTSALGFIREELRKHGHIIPVILISAIRY